jgi:hypothetical protein
MSWSVNLHGDKETVAATVERDLDASAGYYEGRDTPESKAEAQDCRDAKRAILSALTSMSLEPDSFGPDGYEANIAAHGSRSSDYVTLHVGVTKIAKSST